ncbi:DUF934 domain-containing protein [Kordiimonas gwangyangensis]|uniref:DUF934 domain-containing protein n=1 Tax=Kordiimonas gwangyangensis TaxID=288022 RepID=UPI000364A27E|nr:DUF934 domain-containing protein [Kordiimonas gwangyangensis]
MALVNLTGIDAGKWDLLEDGQTPAEGKTVAVPLAELRDAEEAFFTEDARIGALVPTDANYKDLAPLANKLAFVVINFPAFGDGRGFSLAVRLRKDLGFKGEIRASGHTIPDQALFLKRAGFDTVEIPIERKAAFEAALKRFDAFYQSDFQGQVSVAHLRHAKTDEDKDAERKAS